MMSASDRHQEKYAELQQEYDLLSELLSEKLAKLREARIIENDPVTQFKLDKQIAKEKYHVDDKSPMKKFSAFLLAETLKQFVTTYLTIG